MRRRAVTAMTILLALLPVLALASGGGEAAHPWRDIIFKFINLGVLLGIFYYALRKVVPQALLDRKEGVAKELCEAKKAREDAEARLAEYKQKVANLQSEIAALRADFKAEGELQKKRVLEQAQKSVEAISKNAATVGEREAKMAIDSIREEAVKQALALAEEILAKAYGAEDQKRAIEKTIDKIEGLH